MMKKMMMMMTIAILATMTLTGCSLNNELSPFIPVEAAGNESSMTSNVSEVEEPINSTSEVENDTSINISEPVESTTSTTSSTESKPEEKPVESTSSTVESKPVSSTTSSKVEVPVSSSTTASAPVSSSTSKVEKPASSSTTTSSKPVSTTTSSSTSKVEKPASSSNTSSKPTTPVSSSSTTTTSTTTSKPVEKPVHNCSIDGHVWNVTTTTTEPKWCRENHDVTDFGFDLDLASKYLGVNAGEAYKIFKNTCKENGVSGVSGRATIDVEVWGTETYETKECTECGLGVGGKHVATINPIGEWRYIDGQNPMVSANNNYNFNTLFYDPYNVPQVVIDNIRICKGL